MITQGLTHWSSVNKQYKEIKKKKKMRKKVGSLVPVVCAGIKVTKVFSLAFLAHLQICVAMQFRYLKTERTFVVVNSQAKIQVKK